MSKCHNIKIKVEGENVGICNIAGSWRQTTPGVNTTIWIFTHLGENRYRSTEQGGGNARGTAVLRGNILRLDAQTGNLTGYYEWTIDRNCRTGSGKLVFTKGRRGTHASSIVRLASTTGNSSVNRYTRYTNTGIAGSFDVNYFFKNVSVSTCTAECNKHSWCKAFEYISKYRNCYLYRTNARKAKSGVQAYIKR